MTLRNSGFGHRCIERYQPQVHVSINFDIYPSDNVEAQQDDLFCAWHDGELSTKDLLGKAETNPIVSIFVTQTPRFVDLPTPSCVCPPDPEAFESDEVVL